MDSVGVGDGMPGQTGGQERLPQGGAGLAAGR